MSPYNFAPAGVGEDTIFGSCRPSHPVYAPPNSTVEGWVTFMKNHGIERVCCLLDEQHLTDYDDLLGSYRTAFGEQHVCHTPVPDFSVVDYERFHGTIVPFLDRAVGRDTPTVVHCSAGVGRTGHVLSLWVAHTTGQDIEGAIARVRATGRRPLEAATVDQLRACLHKQ